MGYRVLATRESRRIMDTQLAKHDVDTAESTPPDWDLVAFEVSCARCGQDLRGLTP